MAPGKGSRRGAAVSRRSTASTRSIDETMIYVHVAENHRREIPEAVLAAVAGEHDPDRRILKMLAARGSQVAAASAIESENRGLSVS